jgi:hypothetical protein
MHHIDYRDLSVQQLGATHERLLEFDVAINSQGNIVLTSDSTARKLSGSFYTPPCLVQLILDATICPHITEKRAAFKAKSIRLKDDRTR